MTLPWCFRHEGAGDRHCPRFSTAMSAGRSGAKRCSSWRQYTPPCPCGCPGGWAPDWSLRQCRGCVSMVISWKEDSSSTARSSGCDGLDVRQQGRADVAAQIDVDSPAASRSLAMMVVVVVLPSEPVTAMVLQGQTWKNTSISEVMTAPSGLGLQQRRGCPDGCRGNGR